MPPLVHPVTYLSPPKGPALVLTDNETWLGRNSFELSEKAQLLCSRRQACLKITNTAVTLECHGLNPIYFVICQSVNFQASADSPPSRLHQLRKGEAVELVDGDRFFLAPKECLLAVGIKPFKSENDEVAAEQPAPEDAHLNSLDDRSPDQASSPKATQLGLPLTSSPEHSSPRTNLPARSFSAEGCVDLADRCFTREICKHKSPVLESPGLPRDESCCCNAGRNPTGLQDPSINDITVLQADFSKGTTNGDPTCEVLVHMRGPFEGRSSSVSDVHRGPEFARLDSSEVDLLKVTQGDFAAPGGSAEVRGYGSDNEASEGLFVRSIPDTVHCGLDSRGPPEVVVNNNLDAQEASQSTGCVSGRASSPLLGASEGPPPVEGAIDTRRSISASQVAIVSDDVHSPECATLESSAIGAALTQGCTLAASSSPEGRNVGCSGGSTGEFLVHPETLASHLDSRGLAEVVVTSQVGAHGAGEKTCTPEVVGCISSPLPPELDQVHDNMPSAAVSGLDIPQGPFVSHQLCSTGVLSEKATASRSKNLAGAQNAGEMPGISLRQGNMEADGSSPKLVPSSRHLLLGGVDGGSPATIAECSVLPPSRPLNELTDNVRNSQEAQLQSQSAHVEQTMGNDCRVGLIEGMKSVVVTISGYDDILRTKLINLISTVGASYTGSLTKMNTHVVCWKFRGAKYEMAKKLGKCIVNHCWFEDCQKAGVRLPAAPYNASGEMSAPLRWDKASSTQHSTASGFYQDQDCNSRSLGEQSPPAVAMGGPSSHSGKGKEHSGPSALSSRNKNCVLDRGKGHVELNGSANRSQGGNCGPLTDLCQDTSQMGTRPRNGGSPARDQSTHHRGDVQESDEFWNAVIREFDDTTKQVAEPSCYVVSEANRRAGLMEHRTGRTRPGISTTPASSSRGLDLELHDEVRSKRGNTLANEAESSRVAEVEILQDAVQSHALVGNQSANVHREVDHTPSYPEVIQRKRKHAFAIAKINYRRWKYRRLMRNSEELGVSGNLPYQEGREVGLIGDPASGCEPALDSEIVQERASTANSDADKDPDCEQTDAVTTAGSVGEPEKRSGESSSSNEIVCVICHSDTKPVIEGVLACGHLFCYPCIQRWADEAKLKSPTCPLCKVPFDFITFRELGKSAEDGNSEVLEERIVQIGLQIQQETRFTNLPSLRTENLCVTCGSRDTPELLLICTNCRQRAIHTFCLDPPRPPGSSWFCTRCSQLLSRMQTREAYGRLFQGSSPQQSVLRRQDMADVGLNLAPQSRTISRTGQLAAFQAPATPQGTSPAPQSTSAEGLAAGQSSGTPPRRRRQNSLYKFLVRQNDV